MLGSFTELVANCLMRVLCSVLARRNTSASARIGYSIITLVLGNVANQFTSVCELYSVRYGQYILSFFFLSLTCSHNYPYFYYYEKKMRPECGWNVAGMCQRNLW